MFPVQFILWSHPRADCSRLCPINIFGEKEVSIGRDMQIFSSTRRPHFLRQNDTTPRQSESPSNHTRRPEASTINATQWDAAARHWPVRCQRYTATFFPLNEEQKALPPTKLSTKLWSLLDLVEIKRQCFLSIRDVSIVKSEFIWISSWEFSTDIKDGMISIPVPCE